MLKTGTTILSELFVYDIWWVFGTEVVSGKELSRYYGYLGVGIQDARVTGILLYQVGLFIACIAI